MKKDKPIFTKEASQSILEIMASFADGAILKEI